MLGNRYKYSRKSILRLNETQLMTRQRVEDYINAGEYVFENVPCAVCQHTNFELLAQRDRYGLEVSTVICKDCGLLQTNPRMNQESYNKFYDSNYRKLYFGTEVPTDVFFNDQLFRGRLIYDFISKNSPISIRNKLVVEVGTGAGGVLSIFRDNNNEVYGVDLGSEYINFGRQKGLDIHQGTLADIKRKGIRPDLIIYSHVLEHILKPCEELELVCSVLKNDGLVYINVPGLRNLSVSYNQDFLRYLQNAHVYNFSLRTLKNVAQKAGLEYVAGNEEIQAIFKVGMQAGGGPGKIDIAYESDYFQIMNFLRRLEKLRSNPLNLYRMRNLIIEFLLHLLNATGTYTAVRYIYRLFRKR